MLHKKFSKKEETAQRLFDHFKRDRLGNYIIEINVASIDYLFNPYDPAPIHDRDIHPSVMKLIIDQIVVFPANASVELHLHLTKKIKKQHIEADIERALRNHFEYELLDSELHLKRCMQKGSRTLTVASIIFVMCVIAAYLLGRLDESYVIPSLFAEAFFVGAWVTLWHPIEILLYDWLPLYEDKKKYSRLKDMKFRFFYD